MNFTFTHIKLHVHLDCRSFELKEHTADHEFIFPFLQATTVRVGLTWRHSCSAMGARTAPWAPPCLVSVNQALGQTS